MTDLPVSWEMGRVDACLACTGRKRCKSFWPHICISPHWPEKTLDIELSHLDVLCHLQAWRCKLLQIPPHFIILEQLSPAVSWGTHYSAEGHAGLTHFGPGFSKKWRLCLHQIVTHTTTQICPLEGQWDRTQSSALPN